MLIRRSFSRRASVSSRPQPRAPSLALALAACLGCAVAPAFAAGRVESGGLNTAATFDSFIVKYREGSRERLDPAAINRGLEIAARALPGGRRATVRHQRRMALGADVVRVDRALDRVDAETLMRQIAADPAVEYVVVNMRFAPSFTPNDPRYGQQPHYFNATSGINLPRAWWRSNGTGIVVGVVDTGSTPHSDLNGNTLAGFDFITDPARALDGNGRDGDPNDAGDWFVNWACGGFPDTRFERANSSWHGTHVAGTIAALTNNAVGVAGVAFGARVQHARALGRCGGSLEDVVEAMVWSSGGAVPGVAANPTPAQIVNMSLGAHNAGPCPALFQDAINGALARGVTVVVAAGNNNANAANNVPANCAGPVVVGASSGSGGRATFSAFGAGVDIAAPGTSVQSTLNAGAQNQGAETYANKEGTSMSTPHVAGVAALVQARRIAAGLPVYTPGQLETHLRNTARGFPVTPDQPIGAGIVDAYAAVVTAAPAPPIITSLSCSGTGGGYCSVSVDSPTPVSYAWSGGYANSCTSASCSGVCGNLGSFTIKITVTVTNAAGSTSADAWPFCQRSW